MVGFGTFCKTDYSFEHNEKKPFLSKSLVSNGD